MYFNEFELIENSNKFIRLNDGTYFIDRDPLVFDRIFNYLKSGYVEIRDMTLLETDMLKDDLDYYCIPLPEELQPIR